VRNVSGSNSSRLTPLEAYRGIAAVIVVVHHFFLGFAPAVTGTFQSDRTAESVIGHFYFVFFNGTGAVYFFFTLSGFVLSWSYFNRADINIIYVSFLKRYPRLAGVVTLSVVASFFLFYFDLYFFREAAEISGSNWLRKFGNAIDPKYFVPSFWNAFFQGLTTFFTGKSSYNSNLWPMKHEFYGSMLVYMLAPFILTVLNSRHLLYSFCLICCSFFLYNSHMLPFVAGLFLSLAVSRSKPQLPFLVSLILLLLGLYLLGYMVPEKSYLWASHSFFRGMPVIVVHTLGSCAIIFATMANAKLFDSLNGTFFRVLGQISFPLYLVHLLVISSISSFTFSELHWHGLSQIPLLSITFFVTLIVSVLASIPLMKIDDWWVSFLNSFIKKEQSKT